MKLSMKSVILAAVVAAASQFAGAAVITQWNFNQAANTPVATAFVASTGTGTASLVGGTTATLASGIANGGSTDPVLTSPPNFGLNVTTFPAATAENKGRGAQFVTSTAGFQDITLSFDQRHSNTSSRFVQVQYTIDGSNFIDIGDAFIGTAGDTWFNNRAIDLSSIAGVNDNALFGVRVVAAVGANGAYVASTSTSTYSPGGTWRFDMVTINGNVIPEPSALGLLAPAGLLLARRRK